jgi:endonuclease/exonuclease/phosphatase family metal-dependent hydrolase
MKIITLNTWGGRAGKKDVLSFFKKQKDVDIFCLQEIWSAPHNHYEGAMAGGVAIDHSKIMTEGKQEISALLSDHVPYFRPHFGDNYGLLILVRKNLKVIDEGEFFVYKEKGYVDKNDIGDHARNIQYLTINSNGQPITIINFHGLWTGKGKGDTPNRIEQSKKIAQFIQNLKGECILCGDFNLLPQTESIRILESLGLRNLVVENGVTSTRTHFYSKTLDKFADYIFVSKGLEVKNFKVIPDVVSDHTPLMVEIKI